MPTPALAPLFVLLWSSGYVVGAIAIQVAGPVPLLAVRFALASAVAVPLALRHGRWRGAPLGRLAAIGLLLQVVQFGGVYGGYALGVPPALSALVMLGLSPVLTTSLAIATGQERSDPGVWLGLAVGVAGVIIGFAPELGQARIGAGIALTLVGLLGLSGGTVLQRRWGAGVDPRVAAATQSVTATVVTMPVLALAAGRWQPGLKLALSLGWLGWVMGIVSLIALMTLLRRMGASRVSALLLLVPAVTALAAVPVLGDSLRPLTLVGMAIAAVGVGMSLRRPADPAAPRSRAESLRPMAVRGGCR